MATSVAEQIAVKVKTRLGLIAESGGYETTASQVVRPTRLGGFRPRNFQLVVTQGDITPNEELSHPGNPPATAWEFPVIIAGILRQSEKDTTARDTYKNQFWADVVKAITSAGATTWHNWDSLAINSTISPVEDFEADDGSESGFKITVNVTFRTDENNPYNVRA